MQRQHTVEWNRNRILRDLFCEREARQTGDDLQAVDECCQRMLRSCIRGLAGEWQRHVSRTPTPAGQSSLVFRSHYSRDSIRPSAAGLLGPCSGVFALPWPVAQPLPLHQSSRLNSCRKGSIVSAPGSGLGAAHPIVIIPPTRSAVRVNASPSQRRFRGLCETMGRRVDPGCITLQNMDDRFLPCTVYCVVRSALPRSDCSSRGPVEFRDHQMPVRGTGAHASSATRTNGEAAGG